VLRLVKPKEIGLIKTSSEEAETLNIVLPDSSVHPSKFVVLGLESEA
jgi:hypothetical protein